jgi:ATP-GRASP peptide maturase of grasp-with-spasm system
LVFALPMILILSSVNNEETTNYVIDWLKNYKADFTRINGHDLESNSDIDVSLENSNLLLNSSLFKKPLDKIKIVWNRKWRDDDFYFFLDENKLIKPYLRKQLGGHLSSEFFAGTRALQIALKSKKWLTKPAYFRHSTSKFDVIKAAKSFGLTVPNTLVTNNKKALSRFIVKNGSLITKSLSEMEIFLLEKSGYALYTSQILKHELNNYPDRFFPSLFQQLIEKEYEIRAFYLAGTFYSMAIFSQSRNKTKFDFREYDFLNPTRQIPYKLPAKIERKLQKLLQFLDINCGSIDLMRGIDGEYYFLEINPSGQFGMVSIPCNYFLEDVVAKYLINEDN